VTEYAYDALGGAVTLDNVGQIVLQFDDDAQGNAQLTHRYLWGPAVDQILADEEINDLATEGTILWPLTDHLGTVRDLAQYDAATATTTITNHRVFNAFGQLISQTNAAVDHLFGFTGRAQDESTGLQNNLNRWYDAKTGQWLSQDPTGFRGGDTNLRRYVRNSPTEFIDPFGLIHIDPNSGSGAGFGPRLYEGNPVWDQVRALWTRISGGDINGAIRSHVAFAAASAESLSLGTSHAIPGFRWLRAWAIRLDPDAATRGAELARQFNIGAQFTPIASAATVETQTSIIGAEGRAVVSEFYAGRGVTVEGNISGQLKAANAPSRLQGTLARIKAGVKFPHRNDGTVFHNREGLLPAKPPGYYTEYVHPTPGVGGPGAQRVVIGKGGEIYYTPDHYKSFIPAPSGG